MKQTIKVAVKNKDNVLFDEEVHAVSSFNDAGPFDILPFHENFISLIKDKIILHRDGKSREIELEGGVIKVNENKVSIYLGLPATGQEKEEPKGILGIIKNLKI